MLCFLPYKTICKPPIPYPPRTPHLRAQKVADRRIRSLGLVVGIEKKRCRACAPRIGIAYTPDRDTKTLSNVQARLHSSGVVAGGSTVDVELGDGDIVDICGGELGKRRGEASSVVPATGSSKMGLRSNTIDRDTSGNPLVDMSDHTRRDLSVIDLVEVIVVDEQLRVRVRSARSLERNGDEVFAENVVEDTAAHAAVFVENFVHHIPGVNLALIVRHDGSDMVLNHTRKGSLIGDRADPRGELRVPDQRVAADDHVVCLSERDECVARSEVEVTPGGFDGVPFHAVLGCELAEFTLEDSGVLGIVNERLIGAGAEVGFALAFDLCIETVAGRCGTSGRAGCWFHRGRERSGRDGCGGRRRGCDWCGGRARCTTGNALRVVVATSVLDNMVGIIPSQRCDELGIFAVVSRRAGRGAGPALTTT